MVSAPAALNTQTALLHARTYILQGQLVEAKASAEDVLRATPNHPDALNILAIVALRTGDYQQAITLLRAVQGAIAPPDAPGMWVVLGNLATALRATGQWEAADAMLQRALALNPGEAGILNAHIIVMRAFKRTSEAVRTLRRVIALSPPSLEARMMLAELLSENGAKGQAAAEYGTILDLQPDHTGAKAGLAAVAGISMPDPVRQKGGSAEMVAPEDPQGAEDTLKKAFPNVSFGIGVQCIGIGSIRIGEGSCIADDVWLNVCIRDGKTRMNIGNSVLIGRRSHISAGTYLEIGDFSLLAPNVYIASVDHNYEHTPIRPIIQSGIRDHGSVVVEDNCWLAINCVISGNIVIGRGSVVGANAVVRDNVPPFSVVAGIPARIVRMFNPATRVWESVRDAGDLERIMLARDAHPIPTREEYRQVLNRCAKGLIIDPLVAGRGAHLW